MKRRLEGGRAVELALRDARGVLHRLEDYAWSWLLLVSRRHVARLPCRRHVARLPCRRHVA